ncbi:MAG: hypothetical protein IKN77_03850 [Paludibacteraceae bacterium]|nr:hypothetical protein [Paludibacteraceae bacterium]
MIGISKKYIYALLLLLFPLQISAGEELSSHIINSLLSGTKKSPYPADIHKNFVIISIDSLQFGEVNMGTTALVNFKKKDVTKTTFTKKNNKWNQATEATVPIQRSEQNEFIDFILRFSSNKEYQINHTVFPFPINTLKGKEQTKRKLIMPRDWNHLSLSESYPQILLFKTNTDGNNRKMLIFKNKKIKEEYNFIRINKQWYLIEKYEHE